MPYIAYEDMPRAASDLPKIGQKEIAEVLADYFESGRSSRGGIEFFMKAAQAIIDRYPGYTLSSHHQAQGE
jgi:hypothetical protein